MNKVWINKFYESLIEAESSNNSQQIEANLEFKKQHLPKYIYKYRSCNPNSFSDLFHNYVHLSYPLDFNDPFDCTSVCTHEQLVLLSILDNKKVVNKNDFFELRSHFWPKEYCEFVKEKLLKGESYKKIYLKRAAEMTAFSKYEANNFYKNIKKGIDKQVLEISREFKDKFLICSFAATVKNNLMWSHYANSHTGFCLEYNVSNCDQNMDFSRALYPVIYTKKPLLSNINTVFYTDPTKDMLTLMNKSSDWKYEQEYRFLCSGSTHDFFMPQLPSKIYLGLNISEQNQKKIMKFAHKYHIEVRKMEMTASSFELAHKRVYE